MRSVFEPATFMILDLATGNAVAFFEDRDQAESAFASIIGEFPAEKDNLALVSYDKSGFALDTELASDLLSA